jgi:hypothetical protein
MFGGKRARARTLKLIPAPKTALTLLRMNQSHAAGRKTENALGLLALHLDRQLGRLSEALEEALDKAGRTPRARDEYGHHRAGEIGHAMQIAKASAKLVASLAKLDREFRHNISVSRIEEPPPRRPGRFIRADGHETDPAGRLEMMEIYESGDRGDPPHDS